MINNYDIIKSAQAISDLANATNINKQQIISVIENGIKSQPTFSKKDQDFIDIMKIMVKDISIIY